MNNIITNPCLQYSVFQVALPIAKKIKNPNDQSNACYIETSSTANLTGQLASVIFCNGASKLNLTVLLQVRIDANSIHRPTFRKKASFEKDNTFLGKGFRFLLCDTKSCQRVQGICIILISFTLASIVEDSSVNYNMIIWYSLAQGFYNNSDVSATAQPLSSVNAYELSLVMPNYLFPVFVVRDSLY